MTRLNFLRVELDSEGATDVSYTRLDGTYCAVRILDSASAETIAGQLQVLAEQIMRGKPDLGYFNPWRKPRGEGGEIRTKELTAEERRGIASKAAKARERYRKATNPEGEQSE